MHRLKLFAVITDYFKIPLFLKLLDTFPFNCLKEIHKGYVRIWDINISILNSRMPGRLGSRK